MSAAASDNCFEAFGFPNLSQVSSLQTLKIGLHQLPQPTDEDTKKNDSNQKPGWGGSDDDIELTEDAERAAGQTDPSKSMPEEAQMDGGHNVDSINKNQYGEI